ncbi:MAG: LPP20 family lipoprotein [Spirochaetales bacterium]|nr:LPP20 family lipoprotein [Spirochaetales bacterium]
MRKLAVIIIISIFILSCATGGGAVKVDPNRPQWMDNYPASNTYYIGIAGSHTGNEADDRKTAEAGARSNVAASISVEIHNEITILTKDDSDGNYSSSTVDEITAVVEQSLSGVEIVDTFYSEDTGSWVYMRLSKAEWERIKKEEMDAIISRIKEFLTPVLNDFDRPLVTRIQELIKARNLIKESPYSGFLKTTFIGESGSLIDIIANILKQHLDSIYINVKPENIEVETGQSAAFSIAMNSNISSRIGNMPFSFVSETGTNIISSLTDQNGTFYSEIKSGELMMGQNHITLTIDRDKIGFDDSLAGMILPEKVIIVDVQTVSIGFELVTPEGIDLYGADGTVKSLFSSRNLPFKIGSVDSPYIKFDIRISDFPKYLEGAPDMAHASAVISLVKKGKTIYSYESDQFKDGGLTPEQAHDRAFGKLIKGLETNTEFVKGIVEALSLN